MLFERQKNGYQLITLLSYQKVYVLINNTFSIQQTKNEYNSTFFICVTLITTSNIQEIVLNKKKIQSNCYIPGNEEHDHWQRKVKRLPQPLSQSKLAKCNFKIVSVRLQVTGRS